MSLFHIDPLKKAWKNFPRDFSNFASDRARYILPLKSLVEEHLKLSNDMQSELDILDKHLNTLGLPVNEMTVLTHNLFHYLIDYEEQMNCLNWIVDHDLPKATENEYYSILIEASKCIRNAIQDIKTWHRGLEAVLDILGKERARAHIRPPVYNLLVKEIEAVDKLAEKLK